MSLRSSLALLVVALALALASCHSSKPEEVVLYTSVDQPVAAPLVKEFEDSTGIHVVLETDVEASKTAGLAERLRAEKANPRADVWWGNELFHSIALAEEGLLVEYDSPSAKDIAPAYKDPARRWAGTALRVRVIVRGTRPPAGAAEAVARIKGLQDLADPALKGKVAMAKPAFGTTGGQVAALYVLWGQSRAEAYFRALRANDVKLLGGNSVVADSVGQGQLWAGLSDNDDADAARREGGELEALLPDQEEGGIGTLTMPCSAGLVAGAPHPANARKLIDFLLSKGVEKKLIDANFAKYSVFTDPGGPAGVRRMDVDYREVARTMPRAIRSATAILEGR